MCAYFCCLFGSVQCCRFISGFFLVLLLQRFDHCRRCEIFIWCAVTKRLPKTLFLCVCEEALKYHTWKVRCCCLCRIRSFSCEQSWKLCLRFSEGILYVCIDAPCVSAKGGEWVSEGEKMQSSACLSGHAIQHREKPFIQQSLPTPASKLPSNSVRAEWTRWQGSAALSPPYSVLTPNMFVFYSFLLFLILPPKTSALLLFLLCFHSCSFPFMSSL